MSWAGQNNVGTNFGGLGGLGGGDLSGGLQGNMSNQPHATEYTLQGVMRFLQTEWHRHERDRNAWEIERQEMKGRIAALEGAARRADATQKALKKYVTILEKKVKEQAIQLKKPQQTGYQPDLIRKYGAAAKEVDNFRDEKGGQIPFEIARFNHDAEDENQRNEFREFLDQCQKEFTYLMNTPANPAPPRESPPLPPLDGFREDDFSLTGQQQLDFAQQMQSQNMRQQQQQQHQHQHQQQQQQQSSMQNNNNYMGSHVQNASSVIFAGVKSSDLQPTAMTRSNADMGSAAPYRAAGGGGGAQQQEWMPPAPAPPAVSKMSEEMAAAAQAARESFGRGLQVEESRGKKESRRDVDGWDFNDGTVLSAPEPSTQTMQQQQQLSSTRPDTDMFPAADSIARSPNRMTGSHRRKGSMSRRKSGEHGLALNALSQKVDAGTFKLRFGLRGHLDTVRSIIFSGGGSPGEPEICTASDDGLVKRFHIPRAAAYSGGAAATSDLDVQADFTHRGHHGAVLCLASWSPSPNFSTGGRAQGDGWIFSGGQDTFIRVWERGRVDPKATIDGHTDAVWAICVLPGTLGTVFGPGNPYGTPDRILVASGAADGTVRVWAVSAPPQLTSPQPVAAGARRPAASGGRVRGNSMSSGSAFPSSPQPNMASNGLFHHTLVHTITRANSKASPTSIAALSSRGDTFVVSYSDAAIIVYDTRTGEEIASMASLETYDDTMSTSVNAVVTTTAGLDQPSPGEEDLGGGGSGSGGGPTGGARAIAGSGVEGVIISGHEDQFIRLFDANSGQCTYNMLAHPAAISSLSLSPDGRELVSAGHDASLRFWSLEKRSCTQEMTSHRIMRGEGVCSVVWSQDGRWVVSGGGDGVVKVFAR